MLLKTRIALPGVVTRILRTPGGLWFPGVDHVVDRRQNVLGILRRTGAGTLVIPAANIITDAGDIHAAQLLAGESPTNAFTTWGMASAGTPGKSADDDDFTLISGSLQAQDGTYPQTNDGDSDNTGAGTDVRTTRVSYTAAAFSHAAITHGYITNASPGVAEPLYAGWAWASSINKTSADTLKCFHNSTPSGV